MVQCLGRARWPDQPAAQNQGGNAAADAQASAAGLAAVFAFFPGAFGKGPGRGCKVVCPAGHGRGKNVGIGGPDLPVQLLNYFQRF